ncbi:MAG TPA: carboxypeptidase regulatory-like domain-containing protein [Blastocatellia bacterium]|nr:carboxypeptidase regulatory-like domain-containing protein [Blastocatellia bacterium]
MKTSPRYLVACFILLIAAVCASAQTGTSRITGTVTDPQGAVVSDAQVTVKNEATGVTYTGKTTSAGVFAFIDIPVGTYTITVEVSGFRKFVSTGNVLEVGKPLDATITLEVGATTEVVEVQGGFERIESSNAMIGDVVGRRAIRDLPLNGRNPLTLITLEPGLVQRTTNGAGSGTHVNGSRDRSHNVTIDGIDANESSVPNPQSNIYRLNPDNVQEYRVVTHNATAEFGRNSGAQVAIATRSGTNDFHGDLFEFFRNDALNANEFFNNAQKVERPKLRMNMFGVEGGGPIKKDKTFFFGGWQGQRVIFSQPIAQSFGIPTVYTDLARQGIFRFFKPDPKNPLVINGQVIQQNSPLLVDPNTGALRVPLCGGSVTANCVEVYNIVANDPRGKGLDQTIAAFLNKYPSPNTFAFGDGLNTAGFVWNPPQRTVGPNFIGRIDHKFNENNSFFGRYIHADQDSKDGDLLNARPKVFPNFPPLGEVFRQSRNLALNYRRVISPNIVNEFITGFARFHFFFTFGESNPDFPDIEPWDLSNISEPVLNIPHTERALTTIQFIDNISLIHGAHVFRGGFNIRLLRHNDVRGLAGGFNLAPTITFAASTRAPAGFTFPATFLPVSPTNPNGRAGIASNDLSRLQNAVNDLLGIPARISQGFIGDLNQDKFLGKGGLFVNGNRIKQYNYYIQDEWKATPRLTINAGLRIEYNPAPTEANHLSFVPDKPIDGSQGLVNFVRRDRWYSNDNTLAFGPRLSFAWDPFGKGDMVVRAGYGIAFDPISTFQVTAISGKVPGLATQCSTTVGRAPAAGCAAVPDLRIAEGFPKELPPPSRLPSAFTGPAPAPRLTAPDTGAFDPNLKLPTVHEWNLNIQKQLPWGMVAQVGYIGKRGLRLLRAYDLNQIKTDHDGLLESFLLAQANLAKGCRPDGTGCPAGVTGQPIGILNTLFPGSSGINSATSITDLQRNAFANLLQRIDQTDIVAKGFPANFFRPNPQFSQIFYMDSGGNSYYHALQVQLRRQFEKGLTYGLAYTLGKSIDDMSVDPVGAASGGGLSTTNSRTPTDIHNWRLDRGRSDFDNRHVFVTYALWDVPIGRGRQFFSGAPSIVNHIIGGWTLNGIFNYQSGEPYSIQSGALTTSNTHVSRADIFGPKPETGLFHVPGVIGPVVFDAKGFVNNCVETANGGRFCIPPPGKNGNSGRNIFDSPSIWNFDFGVLKEFAITERVRMQFRTEMFNVFNNVNFENPRNATVGSPTITSTVFGQTCCISAATPSTASILALGEAPRVIQFALKLSF